MERREGVEVRSRKGGEKEWRRLGIGKEEGDI